MRLLIAENDFEIATMIQKLLERNNYSVDLVSNSDDAFNYTLSNNYDCIILDATLPTQKDVDALTFLRQRNCTLPILVLTPTDNLMDRVAVLNAGADDCLAKPFATTELLARIRALLRRGDNYVPDLIRVGNLTLNCTTYHLSTDHNTIHLTRKEFQLMECFMRSPGHIFTSDILIMRVWGWDGSAETNVLWTNINSLRRKLKKLHSSIQIQTIRGSGYYLPEK